MVNEAADREAFKVLACAFAKLFMRIISMNNKKCGFTKRFFVLSEFLRFEMFDEVRGQSARNRG